jgi:phage-related protein
VTQPIDVAYVDIVVRDKTLKQTERDIDRALDKIERNIASDLKKIDDDFDDAFAKIDKHFTTMEKQAESSFKEVTATVEESFSDIEKHIDHHDKSLRRRFTLLGAHVKDTFDDVSDNIARGLTTAFRGVGNVITSIGGALGQLGGGIGGFVSGSPLLALIVALTPAIIALAAALVQLIGLVGVLPASLGILISAIVPVVVAFQNFGDAVSALASGDLEKIDEALKKLSPSAAAFAREVANALPVLREFQKSVQDAFFRQLQGQFSKLINTVLPGISENFNGIAIAMGTLAAKFVQFATSLNFMNALNDIFNETSNIINKLSDPLFRFLDAISVSISASIPFVDRLADAFGRALDKFSAFINKSVETGAFDEFIEDAFTTVKELIDLVKASGGLLGTLFAGTEDAGHGFIKTLTDIITRLDDFFKSAEGQDVIRDMVIIVKALGSALGFLVSTFVFLDQQFRVSLAVLEIIGHAFVVAFDAVTNFLSQIPAKISEFGAFLTQIPTLIGQGISAAIDAAFTFIGTQIGLLLFTIQVLPGKIVDFFASIPERIRTAVSNTGPTLLDIFTNALTSVQELITQKFSEILAFIRSVPGRIIALAPVFLQAGKNLITSFMNGFKSVGSFIGDVAGSIVSSVKGFLNKAIDRINSGIAAIDAVLPGNLARIPRLASGALVSKSPGGTLAVVGEGNEDEVVAPLSKLEDIIRKAFGGDGPSGMTVNFGPGAISISFSGVAPTQGEARAVGQAVGDGIADRLAKRNVRTQLRTV